MLRFATVDLCSWTLSLVYVYVVLVSLVAAQGYSTGVTVASHHVSPGNLG